MVRAIMATSAAILLAAFLCGCMTEGSVRRVVVDEMRRADVITDDQRTQRDREIDEEHPTGIPWETIATVGLSLLLGVPVAARQGKRMAVKHMERKPSRSGIQPSHAETLNDLAEEQEREREREKLVEQLKDAIVITETHTPAAKAPPG